MTCTLLKPIFALVKNNPAPLVGMEWNSFGALGVDRFKIVDVVTQEEVVILEDGHPQGPRIKTVQWPDHLDHMRGQMPRHFRLKYLGVNSVSTAEIDGAKSWAKAMESRQLDF